MTSNRPCESTVAPIGVAMSGSEAKSEILTDPSGECGGSIDSPEVEAQRNVRSRAVFTGTSRLMKAILMRLRDSKAIGFSDREDAKCGDRVALPDNLR